MRSVNKVLLMGYVVADPEVKTTTNGNIVTKFRIATNRDWRSNDGERHQSPDYHRVVAWKRLGEVCGEFLKKGSGLYLEGKLMNHQYKDKEGNNRNVTEIVADVVNFISYKKFQEGEEVNLVEVPAV